MTLIIYLRKDLMSNNLQSIHLAINVQEQVHTKEFQLRNCSLKNSYKKFTMANSSLTEQ